MNSVLTRGDYRTHIRQKRAALSNKQQAHYAEQLAIRLQQTIQHLIEQTSENSPLKLAIYLANDGELNPQPFIDWCWQKTSLHTQQNIEVYLPVIHPFCKGNLLFLRYTPSTLMVNNCYGIAEPKLNILTLCPANELDIIFTPLVAFDNGGNRLGMGGGFYDRTLAKLNITSLERLIKRSNTQSKTLPNTEHLNRQTAVVGLAHQCQQVEQLPTELWDVPLPNIITPEKLYAF